MATLDQANTNATPNTLQEFKTKFLSLNNLNTKETMDYFTQYRKEVNARITELNQEERAILKDIVTLKYNDITTGTNTAAEKYLPKKQSEAVAESSVPAWGKKANALNSIPDEDFSETASTTQGSEAVSEIAVEEVSKTTGPVEVQLPPIELPKQNEVEGKAKGTTTTEAKTQEEVAKRVEEIKEEYKEIDKEQGIISETETPKPTEEKKEKPKSTRATKTKQTENAPKLDDTATENKNPTEHLQTKTERNGDPINAEISQPTISKSNTKYTITRRINLPVNNQAYTNNEVTFAIEGESLIEILNLEKELIKHELLTSLEVNEYLAGKKQIGKPNPQPVSGGTATGTTPTPTISAEEIETTKAKNLRFRKFLTELYEENEVAVTNTDGSMCSLSLYIKNRFAEFQDKNPIDKK